MIRKLAFLAIAAVVLSAMPASAITANRTPVNTRTSGN